MTSVWGVPFERTPYLTVSEVKDLLENLPREAQRQQENLAVLSSIVYHLPGPKTKRSVMDFFTGYAVHKEDPYGSDLSEVMRQDLKFALAHKKLSQAAFDGLTL